MGVDANPHAGFSEFFAAVEPRLRRALVAHLGTERGREAAAEALAWAFEHWSEVCTMTNPTGYLYRVGTSRTRPRKVRPAAVLAAPIHHDEPRIEPGLRRAIEDLSPQQRVAVVLRSAHGWTLEEVAELTGSSISSVNTHHRRAMAKLRAALKVEVAP